MNKLYVGILLSLLLLVSIVYGQSLENVENQIEGVVNNLENNITKIKEFGEKDKWDFIGSQWKEFLLKNKLIAGVDAFFTKINVVFVVLFAHDWAISIEMLFVFLLWLFTLLSCGLIFFKNRDVFIRWIVSIILTLTLTWLQVFNKLAVSLVSLIFLSNKLIIQILSFLLIIFSFILLNRLFSLISKKIDSLNLKGKEHEREVQGEKIKGVVSGIEQTQESERTTRDEL